jgi:L-ascorbate metabolism protein UlaG (beta-lactamase superfamily)
MKCASRKSKSQAFGILLLGGTLLLSTSFGAVSAAQRDDEGEAPPPHDPTVSDIIETEEGDLTITPISHASLMMEFQGRRVYVDPVGDFSEMSDRKADIVLITDIHGDHMNAEAARSVTKTGAVVIAPREVWNTITTAVVYLNGETSRVTLPNTAVGIEAVPAYNLTRGPEEGQFYHPMGRGQGYIVTIAGKRVFVSGDTECVPEIQALENIDVAFLPMNLPFTMTPEEAAECAKTFRPSIVYPYHYRGQDPAVFANALSGESDIEVRIREWY